MNSTLSATREPPFGLQWSSPFTLLALASRSTRYSSETQLLVSPVREQLAKCKPDMLFCGGIPFHTAGTGQPQHEVHAGPHGMCDCECIRRRRQESARM